MPSGVLWLALIFLCVNGELSRYKYVQVITGDQTCNVLNYGAKGDGKTDDTSAMQKAIDACCPKGGSGGHVLLPTGKNFLSFPLYISGNSCKFEIAGEITANKDREKWPGFPKKCPAVITANQVSNVLITGNGTMKGQGKYWWPFVKNTTDCRPHMIDFKEVQTAVVTGITVKNGPTHNLELYANNCEVVGVTILAPRSENVKLESHNTDGIDVHGSPFWVHHSHISVGDDLVAIHASNVLVEDCTFGTGHGASIGSLCKVTLFNITVRNCVFQSTDTGPRIKSDKGCSGNVYNVYYQNLTLHDMKTATITVNQYYPGESESGFKLHDIYFENINSYNPASAGSINCESDKDCYDFTLKNVNSHDPKTGWSCKNAKFKEISGSSPKPNC